MDWSKAKSVLILIFVVLNVFLFINVSTAYFGNEIPKETLDSAKKILANYGITLKVDLPKRMTNDIMLTFDNGALNRLEAVQKLLGNIPYDQDFRVNGKKLVDGTKTLVFNDDYSIVYEDTNPSERLKNFNTDEVKKFTWNFLRKAVQDPSGYVVDSFSTDAENGSVRIIYRESYKKLVVMDNYVVFTLHKDSYMKMEYRYRKPNKDTHRNKKTIPVHTILLKSFIDGKMGVITGLDLGLKVPSVDADTKNNIAVLVWRVKLEGGKERYFRAVDGEEILGS